METPFRPSNFFLCALSLSLAIFMQILDTTIANVALPSIAGNLGASANQSTWVVTSFTICNAIAMPLTGWLVRRVGEVRLFLISVVLFTLTSALCGAATNMNMLIVFRALQGFVAGPMYPVTQALMISLYPPARRSQAIVVITIVGVLAPLGGPILGGWITDNFSWPWIFFINVPVGIFSAYTLWWQMRRRPEKTERVKVDYVGLISLALGVSALQIMLDLGNDEDWFESSFIVAAAAVAAISIAVFLIWEFTEKDPIVDLRLFRHRNFTVGTLTYMLCFGAFFGATVLVPLWAQTQLHYTPLWAGLVMAPAGIGPLLLAPFIGKFAHRLNMRVMMSVAFAAYALSCYLRSRLNLEIDFTHIAYIQFIQGVGTGLFFVPIITITLSDLKPNEISSGSGLSMFMRTLGGSFFVSATNYLWNMRATVHHSQLAEKFTRGDAGTAQTIHNLGQGDIQSALTRIDMMVNQQAYQISFNEMFLGYTIVFIGLAFVIWLAKPPFTGKTAAAVSE